MPERPFVLVGQQYLADPLALARRRPPGLGLRPRPERLRRATPSEAILDQIERFAPGLRERIVAPRDALDRPRSSAYNANYVGGDIITGANTPLQTARSARGSPPTPTRPASPGVYICSAATPPGAGAHGMCGYNAANGVLRKLARSQQ